jgi:hypothetical protein
MTAIIRTGTPSSEQLVIPASIVTVEQLATWSLRVLWQLHKNGDFIPDSAQAPVRRIQRSPFINGQGRFSILYSCYFTYNDLLGVDPTLKEWTAINEMSDVVPSNAFNS